MKKSSLFIFSILALCASAIIAQRLYINGFIGDNSIASYVTIFLVFFMAIGSLKFIVLITELGKKGYSFMQTYDNLNKKQRFPVVDYFLYLYILDIPLFVFITLKSNADLINFNLIIMLIIGLISLYLVFKNRFTFHLLKLLEKLLQKDLIKKLKNNELDNYLELDAYNKNSDTEKKEKPKGFPGRILRVCKFSFKALVLLIIVLAPTLFVYSFYVNSISR